MSHSTKTKLIWSITQRSFERKSVDEIAAQVVDTGLGAVRFVMARNTREKMPELRKAIASRMASKWGVPTPEGWVPFLASFIGRRATLRLPPGAPKEALEGQTLEVEILAIPQYFTDGFSPPLANGRLQILASASDMVGELKVGSAIWLSYGQVECELIEVKSAAGTGVVGKMKVVRAGALLDGMDVHSPEMPRGLFPLLPHDLAVIEDGCLADADYVLVSGLQTRDQLAQLRKQILPGTGKESRRHPTVAITDQVRQKRAELPPRIILKVDSESALKLVPELMDDVDGILLSRSELGLTVNCNSLPLIQKELLARGNQAAKVMIVASELMYSMRTNPNPTRAEVSDMANAAADGADALFLSEDVTEGPFGTLVAEVSHETLQSSESFSEGNWHRVPFEVRNEDDAIAFGALEIAERSGAKAIVCLTEGGYTAVRLSSLQTPVPVIAFTYNTNVMRQLNLLRGVTAFVLEGSPHFEDVLSQTKLMLTQHAGFHRGDSFVFVSLTASPVSAKNSNLFTLQTVE